MIFLDRLRNRVTRSTVRRPINWMQHRGLGPEDVFVGGYPKSGTTWLRFLLYQLAVQQPGGFAEVNHGIPDVGYQFGKRELPSINRRLVKTHEPYRPEYRRALYLVRDPRDVVLSEYHYQIWTNLISDETPFDVFLEWFFDGTTNRYGAWTDHVQSWLNAAEANGDILVLTFEEMKADTVALLRRVASFLKVERTDDQLVKIVADNSIAQMKVREEEARKTVFRKMSTETSFVRKGKSGGWRKQLTPEQVERIVSVAADVMGRIGYDTDDCT